MVTDLSVTSWRRAAAGAARREGDPPRRIETARNRLLVAMGVFFLCFCVLAGHTVNVAVLGGGEAGATVSGAPGLGGSGTRGDIVDRTGAVLATNLPSYSLFMDPTAVQDAEGAAERLRAVLPSLDPDRLIALAHSGKRFQWVRRNLTPDEMHAVNRLGLPGFAFRREERRVYPQGPLFAHVVGFTDVDHRGIAGIERGVDDVLRARAGAPLALSVDIRVQHIVEEALARAMEIHRPKGAASIVMDAETGEILAMVSLPTFDPNTPDERTRGARFNRATLGAYELGSTFKALTAAMALDLGVAELDDSYDATEPLRVSRFTIRDYHPENRWLTIPEIIVHSSNIGAARLALDVGTTRQRAFLEALGFLDPLDIELPETGRPIVPSRWTDLSTMTIGFGHGIAVTPLHMVSAFATLVNGGTRVTPTLLRVQDGAAPAGERVISADTSALVRHLLYLAVTEGTGSRAAAPGYLIGGKTGTAEKAIGGRYKRDAVIATFAGVFPIDAPRYVVLAMLDQPQPSELTHGFVTGGWTAAPVVGEVIQRVGPLLGVPPLIDEESAEDLGLFVQASDDGGRVAAF